MRPYKTLCQAHKMVNSVQTSIKRSLSPEVTVLDVEQKSSPQAKKPRLSAVGEGEERDKVKSGPAMARAAAIAAAVGTGSSSGKAATAVATSRKPATASAPVKKTIFMPGCKYLDPSMHW